MARELRNEDVWHQCGFERPPFRRTLDRFLIDFELVAEDVFIEVVHELAEQIPLGKLFRIDGTDKWRIPRNAPTGEYAVTVLLSDTTFEDESREKSGTRSTPVVLAERDLGALSVTNPERARTRLVLTRSSDCRGQSVSIAGFEGPTSSKQGCQYRFG